VTTYLDRIVAAHRAAAAVDARPLDQLIEQARRSPAPRDFRGALAAADGLGVIAEIKRRSPSKGDLAPDLDPAALASLYREGGATCLSVLTDVEHFGGSPDDLSAARGAVDIPVLRKDFTVSDADVCDARIMGADCVLLIVAALSDDELGRFMGLARDLDLSVLVEVHDEPELDRAVAVGADIVGINQRDLVTFEVDTHRAERMAPLVPHGAVKVAESGVRNAVDAARLAAAGYDAVLVGESLVTSGDPRGGVAAMRRAAQN
jgi:indole-3-glycerol phosphate synthase